MSSVLYQHATPGVSYLEYNLPDVYRPFHSSPFRIYVVIVCRTKGSPWVYVIITFASNIRRTKASYMASRRERVV